MWKALAQLRFHLRPSVGIRARTALSAQRPGKNLLISTCFLPLSYKSIHRGLVPCIEKKQEVWVWISANGNVWVFRICVKLTRT